MSGEGEGKGGKIDGPLVISIAALLLGAAQFVREMNDDGEAKDIELAERLTAVECELGIGRCETVVPPRGDK